jgi:hypothetical protein
VRIPIEIRFYRFAVKQGKDKCWPWLGYSKRYGYIWDPNVGKCVLAHRKSYEINIGRIPDGMNVLHKCDNTLCVNPHHLFLGTQQDNMADKKNKGRTSSTVLPGELCKHNTLTNKDVLEIRACKTPIRKLAKKYGVSCSTIWRARKIKTFRNI